MTTTVVYTGVDHAKLARFRETPAERNEHLNRATQVSTATAPLIKNPQRNPEWGSFTTAMNRRNVSSMGVEDPRANTNNSCVKSCCSRIGKIAKCIFRC